MYERMLNKEVKPTMEEMASFCGENRNYFALLNQWLSDTFETEQQIVFPYGNKYGWGIAHRKSKKLLCNIFAENNAFTVMMRLSDKQYKTVYDKVQRRTQEYIDNKYPCGDGGWIHYRIVCAENFDDAKLLLFAKHFK